jgi:hypothetical protein
MRLAFRPLQYVHTLKLCLCDLTQFFHIGATIRTFNFFMLISANHTVTLQWALLIIVSGYIILFLVSVLEVHCFYGPVVVKVTFWLLWGCISKTAQVVGPNFTGSKKIRILLSLIICTAYPDFPPTAFPKLCRLTNDSFDLGILTWYG